MNWKKEKTDGRLQNPDTGEDLRGFTRNTSARQISAAILIFYSEHPVKPGNRIFFEEP